MMICHIKRNAKMKRRKMRKFCGLNHLYFGKNHFSQLNKNEKYKQRVKINAEFYVKVKIFVVENKWKLSLYL